MHLPSIQQIAGDSGNGHYALWAACARIWHSGEIPLWNPFQWGGYSAVGSIQEVFYPILIALEFFFWDDANQMLSYAIYPAYIAIHFIIAGCGIYVLGRSRDKKPEVSCMVVFLTLSTGWVMFTFPWAYIFGSYCWLPFLIWALYKMVETENLRWVSIAGFILAMLVLSSTAQGALFAILVYFILFFSSVSKKKCDIKKMLDMSLRFACSGFIGMGIGSVELFPFFETNINAFRYIPSLSMIESQYKIPLSMFKEHAIDLRGIDTGFGGYVGIFAVPTLALVVGLIGYFSSSKEHDWLRRFAAIILFLSFSYSIGFVVTDIFWYIPGYNAIREPFLYMPLFVIASSIFMFDGIETIEITLRHNDSSQKNIFNKSFSFKCLLGVLMFVSILPHMILNKCDLIVKCLIILVGIALSLRVRFSRKVYCFLLFIILALNTANWCNANLSNNFKNASTGSQKVLDVNLRVKALFDEVDSDININNNGIERYLCWYPGAVIPDNIASILGERDCFAYLNPVYKKNYFIHQFLDVNKRVQLQNVKYVLIGNENTDFIKWIESTLGNDSVEAKTRVYASYADIDDQVVRYIDTSDLKLGAGWIANNIVTYQESMQLSDVENAEKIFQVMNDPNINFADTVLINVNDMDRITINPKEETVKSTIRSTRFKANHIVYDVDSNTDGIFVTSEINYPGWKVIVDGHKSDLLEVNYCFMGTVIEKGNHVIEFVYSPKSLAIGVVVAVISLVVAVGCLGLSYVKVLKIGKKDYFIN